MQTESVSVKLQGQKESVELVVEQLRKLYKMLVIGQILQNDKDDGVHIFLSVDPQLVNRVMQTKTSRVEKVEQRTRS
jgi:hypothetical protein